jgi:hypothetical protein
MNLFRYYALTAFLFNLIGTYFYVKPERFEEYKWVNQMSIVFHFYFISIVINKIHERNSIYFNPRLFSIVSAVLIIVIIPVDPFPGAGFAYLIANSALVILGISYFTSLYKSEKLLVLKSSPGYWIAAGVTIGLGMTLPYLAIIWYFKDRAGITYIQPLILVAVLGYAIMQYFFIKAMKCTTILN